MPKPSSPLEGMPLPTAALVIDTRNKTAGNYILNTLKYEIDTLCQEMHMEQVNQWRYLTSIIEYLSVGTLGHSELQNYRNPHKPQPSVATGASPSAPAPVTSSGNTGRYAPTVMGQVDTQTLRRYTFFRGNPQRRSLDDIPEGNFKDNIRRILSLCDTLRTKRVNATIDLGTQGNLGRTRPEDGMVRVIFIADAQSEDSLATAATYAAYLRKETLFQNAYEQQLLISTMIICLNHENRGEAPKLLIDALSWDNNDSWPHIDSCIPVEKYSEHGARLTDEAQEEHIEFLLYILIITDPYQLRIDVPSPNVEILLEQSAKWRMLPSEKCFSIGLSAFTYSARWGRYLLNSALTQLIAQELTDCSQALSAASTKVTVNKWLDEQFATVQSAIPEQVAGDMPELNALAHAEAVARPANEVFPTRSLRVHVGKRSLATLDRYADELEVTYTTSAPQQASLQDAIQREPTIRDYIYRWKGDAGSPLMKVLTNAYRVLADQRFSDKTSARGAMPRAKHQLHEIAAATAERQNKHRGNAVNPLKQREDLHNQYEAERQALEALDQQFPFLGRSFKGVMAVVTLLLWLFVALVVSLAGLAWLHHVALLYAQPVLSLFGQGLFGISFLTVFTLITVVIVVLFVGITALICSRSLFGSRGSSMKVEIAFLISLVIFTLFGVIVSFSLIHLVDDVVALVLISWLSVLPSISVLTGIVAFVVALFEVSYFFMWHRDVVRERTRIINTLRDQHLQAVSKARQYLADAFLLALLQRADLVDETGTDHGRYYAAVEQLPKLLGTVHEQAEERYQMIQQHLERITENETKGPASSKLYLREELLDVTALKNRLATLQASIHANTLFIEFAELFLRELGVETPDMILRDVEQRPRPAKTPFEGGSYQYEAQFLLSMMAAQALELSLEQPLAVPPDVDMLEKRYKGLDYHYQYVLMRNLIEQVKVKFASRTNKKKGRAEMDVELATGALTAWIQLLWEHDEPLKKLLTREGVLDQMERENYSPQTMRTKFILRTAPVNRSMYIGQQTDTYLIAFPSNRGTKLLRELDIARVSVDFPDEELLALLSLSHYVAMPYKVEETCTLQLGPGHSNSTAGVTIGQLPSGNNVSTDAQQDVISGVQPVTPATSTGDLSA